MFYAIPVLRVQQQRIVSCMGRFERIPFTCLWFPKNCANSRWKKNHFHRYNNGHHRHRERFLQRKNRLEYTAPVTDSRCRIHKPIYNTPSYYTRSGPLHFWRIWAQFKFPDFFKGYVDWFNDCRSLHRIHQWQSRKKAVRDLLYQRKNKHAGRVH